MPKFIVVASWTEQGVSRFKEVPDRVNAWRKQAGSSGCEVKEVFMILGAPFDTLSIVSAPSDEAIARLCLEVAALGNVKTQTFRAFSEDEVKKIVK